MSKDILFRLYGQNDDTEIQHLLLTSIDGTNQAVLSAMAGGTETEIARGAQYEMEDKAREYITAGKFRVAGDDDKIFEPLRNTMALAIACGHTIVYDPRYKKFPQNPIGTVPLNSWPGLTGNNGGGYEYALDGLKILARPTLPPNHGLNMKPPTNAEMVNVMRSAIKILNTVGPAAEFILGGSI
jgi:hypothetical protein